jgi:hypothetical protein
MDEAIGQVDRRAKGFARAAEGIPFGPTEYFQDQHGRGISKLGEPGNALPLVMALTPDGVMLL